MIPFLASRSTNTGLVEAPRFITLLGYELRPDRRLLDHYGRQYFRPLSGVGVHFGISPCSGGVLAFSRVLNDQEVLVVANTTQQRWWPVLPQCRSQTSAKTR